MSWKRRIRQLVESPEDIIDFAVSIKEPIFPPYKPNKKFNTNNLVSATQHEENVKKISQEKVSHKEFTYSIKPVNELSIPQNLNFKTKTANYIYKVIPNEEDLIKNMMMPEPSTKKFKMI